MTFKFEWFIVIQKKKKAHKYKIIKSLSSFNFIYRVRYVIMFFMVYIYIYIGFLVFYIKLTH